MNKFQRFVILSLKESIFSDWAEVLSKPNVKSNQKYSKELINSFNNIQNQSDGQIFLDSLFSNYMKSNVFKNNVADPKDLVKYIKTITAIVKNFNNKVSQEKYADKQKTMVNYEAMVGKLSRAYDKAKNKPILIYKIWQTESERDQGISIDNEFDSNRPFFDQLIEIESYSEKVTAREIWLVDKDDNYIGTLWSDKFNENDVPFDFDYKVATSLIKSLTRRNKSKA